MARKYVIELHEIEPLAEKGRQDLLAGRAYLRDENGDICELSKNMDKSQWICLGCALNGLRHTLNTSTKQYGRACAGYCTVGTSWVPMDQLKYDLMKAVGEIDG